MKIKKILLIIPSLQYNFVYKIIENINKNSEIDLYLLEKDVSINFPTNNLFNFIDKKFPVFCKSPLELIDNKEYSAANIKVKFIKSISEDFDLIIDFCDTNLMIDKVLSVKTNFNKNEFLRFTSNVGFVELNLKYNKKENTFIYKFSNEKGLTNNYFKYLYSISYTIRFFIEENSIIFTKNKEIVNYKSFYLYYFSLVKELLVRKLNYSQLNWKLAFLNKDNTIKIINKKKGEYWADPFIINNGEGKFVFFEELENPTRKGIISLLKFNSLNEIVEKKEVINLPFHMSFPNVFAHNGEYFMLPEQIESNQLVLYKAKNFPYEWENYQVIFNNVKAVDPSLVFYNGMYYLFTNIVEEYEYDNNERMSIFYTKDLLSGKWDAHPKNPVKIDVSSTRNAGRIFEENGEIIRMAQNCNPTYGFSTKKMKITKLSPTEFEEIEIKHIKLNGYEGNHTYDKEQDLTLIDVLVKE